MSAPTEIAAKPRGALVRRDPRAVHDPLIPDFEGAARSGRGGAA
ncbi:hypothetical protein [Nocardia panacis]|nr:hypothetical protein [Nocardia panacis]